jgi:rSAM/selenodomain-associated transferase 2
MMAMIEQSLGTFQEHSLEMSQPIPDAPAEASPSCSPLAQGGGQLSVIMPTLNAADTLKGLLQALNIAAIVKEIVIVDGGSSDDTATIAREAGARVIAAPRGRGIQLAAGAEAAAGDWLLFLHADCRLEPGWEAAVRSFLSAPRAGLRAGYFDFGLDDPMPAARRLERIVACRCRVLALPYGDQGLLISRPLYCAVGGFAPLPLMEDVDLVRRLGRRRLARIGARCLSSPRRYRREGYWRRPLRNLFCLSLYFAGVSPSRIIRLYG